MNYRCLLRASLVGLAMIGLSACADQSLDVAQPEVSQLTEERVQAMIAAHRAKHEAYSGPTVFAPLGDDDPVPIPGGLAPGLHLWLPGPVELGFQGKDVEPNTITNFQGLAAVR